MLRLGISTKLIFMITVVICAAIGSVMYISTDLFKEESITKVQEGNKDLADSLASQSFNIFKDAVDKTTLIAKTLMQKKTDATDTIQIAQNILRSNDELISVGIYKKINEDQYDELYFITKDEVLAEYNISLQNLKTLPMNNVVGALKKKHNGNVYLLNTSSLFKKPILTLFFFTQENQLNEKWLVRSELRQDQLIKLFSKKPNVTSYLVDSEGHLLVHSDPKLVLKNYDFSSYAIVQKTKDNQLNNHQMEFFDDQGYSYLGAFKKVGFASTSVVTQTETEKALAALNRVQYRSLLVMVIVLGMAFILSFIFSNSMTSPLGTLYRATEKIAKGQFDVHLTAKSNDEIGALTSAFSKMAIGLQERDKLKTTFNKFHSKEIAQKIMHGEMKLGGEKKTATVFFSDIRGFTTLSEQMSPDEVVHMLNEYMTEMVRIIQKHHGVVDKYVGDAIMALWGVPEATGQDAANSVRAALEMRDTMVKLNNKRKSRGLAELKIGMGIHTGEVLAGNIGSEERLEYTVIGDTVNQASRIESANKDFESDLLISDTTYALIKNQGFAFGPELNIKVKGKAEKISIYQVIGTTDSSGNIKTTLSASEQEKIKKQPELLKEKEVLAAQPTQKPYSPTAVTQMMNPQIGGLTGSMPIMPITHSGHAPAPEATSFWYLVRDVNSQQVEGPYSVNQLRVMAAQPGFHIPTAYVFKDGDAQMVPMMELPEFSRRAPVRPQAVPAGVPLPNTQIINVAGPSEWFIYVSDTQTMGPYNLDQLEQMMASGSITRTTYVWKQGMQSWMYLYQIPGFDRRVA